MGQVIIMQGLPGSGKSTYAKNLVRNTVNNFIVSADDHFVGQDGVYRFNLSEVGKAHNECLREFIELLQDGVNRVIVDNTNTTVLEIAPYMSIAQAYGYEAKIVRVVCDKEMAKVRNTHSVPEAKIEQMAANLEGQKLPPWWWVETWSPNS